MAGRVVTPYVQEDVPLWVLDPMGTGTLLPACSPDRAPLSSSYAEPAWLSVHSPFTGEVCAQAVVTPVPVVPSVTVAERRRQFGERPFRLWVEDFESRGGLRIHAMDTFSFTRRHVDMGYGQLQAIFERYWKRAQCYRPCRDEGWEWREFLTCLLDSVYLEVGQHGEDVLLRVPPEIEPRRPPDERTLVAVPAVGPDGSETQGYLMLLPSVVVAGEHTADKDLSFHYVEPDSPRKAAKPATPRRRSVPPQYMYPTVCSMAASAESRPCSARSETGDGRQSAAVARRFAKDACCRLPLGVAAALGSAVLRSQAGQQQEQQQEHQKHEEQGMQHRCHPHRCQQVWAMAAKALAADGRAAAGERGERSADCAPATPRLGWVTTPHDWVGAAAYAVRAASRKPKPKEETLCLKRVRPSSPGPQRPQSAARARPGIKEQLIRFH